MIEYFNFNLISQIIYIFIQFVCSMDDIWKQIYQDKEEQRIRHEAGMISKFSGKPYEETFSKICSQ